MVFFAHSLKIVIGTFEKKNMKISTFFMSLFFILALCNSGKAQDAKDSLTFNKVIVDYIESVKHTDFEKVKSVLGNDAIVKIPRFGKVIIETKNELVQEMKRNQGIEQNFNYTYSTVCFSDAISIAKVKLTYPSFNLYEYLIIEKQEERWKITQVIKEYYDKTDKDNISLADDL